MLKTTAFIGLGLCVLLLSGCGPKIDGSSAKAYEESLVKVASGLDIEKKAIFLKALDVVIRKTPQSSELIYEVHKRVAVSGKSADQIIAEATQIAVKDYAELNAKIAATNRPADSDVVSNLVLNVRSVNVDRIEPYVYKYVADVDVVNKNKFDVDGFCASMTGTDGENPTDVWKANVNFGYEKRQGLIESGKSRRLKLVLLKPMELNFQWTPCRNLRFYGDEQSKIMSMWTSGEGKQLIRLTFSDVKPRIVNKVTAVYSRDTSYSSESGCGDSNFDLDSSQDNFLTLIKYKR
jgi:hypothetical protein